jgi:bacterioferritin-associated ferredoxin
MIVCVCEGVSDREVAQAIEEGAASVKAIRQACGAGRGCGQCRQMLRSMLHETGRARSGVAPRLLLATGGVST